MISIVRADDDERVHTELEKNPNPAREDSGKLLARPEEEGEPRKRGRTPLRDQ